MPVRPRPDTYRMTNRWEMNPRGPRSQRLALWATRIAALAAVLGGLLRIVATTDTARTIGGLVAVVSALLLITALAIERHERRAED